MLDRLAVLYTDAESTGRVAAVLIVDGVTRYWVSQVPAWQRARLCYRRTQIVPFECMAAISGLLVFDQAAGENTRILHVIDSTFAVNVVLKGASRHKDLNALLGSLWYRLCEWSASYWARRAPSALNLADGPSCNQFEFMTTLNAVKADSAFPDI